MNSESSGSDSGSTPEEERIRRLFQTCDGNGDGYIDGQDLLAVCRQLNLEHCVGELMEQLGADEEGRISYGEFLRRRMQLMSEINALTLQEQAKPCSPAHGGQTTMTSSPPWRAESDTSQGALSERHESWEFDSASRDLSPEPNSLQKLIEASGGTIPVNSKELLELANKLHLAALSSLRREVYDLSKRERQLGRERESLERRLGRAQLEQLHLAREREERLEQQAQRYEERITELHSVIAELSKKLDMHRAAVIKEEDEYSQQSGEESRISDVLSHCTSNENLVTESISDRGDESPPEYAGLVCGKDSHTEIVHSNEIPEGEDTSSGLGDNESIDEKPQVSRGSVRCRPYSVENRATSCHSLQVSQCQEEVASLRVQNIALHEQLSRREADLHRARAALASTQEDRDRAQRKVRELQGRQSQQSCCPGSPQLGPSSPMGEEASTMRGEEGAPVAKMAERVRLRKLEGSSQRHILGSEMAALGISSTKVAEQLVQQLQEESNTQEAIVAQRLRSSGSPLPEGRLREFEVETERLSSKVEHLRCQNDLLQLALEESRGQCDRLSVLLGKHESNQTALQLALACSDRALEAFDALLALADSGQGLVLASCRAAGLVSLTAPLEELSGKEQEDVSLLLQRMQEERRLAEGVARQLLHRMDRQYGLATPPSCNLSPWEDLSSHSHTTSTTSSTSSSCDGGGDLSKAEEQRLREYLGQLRSERSAVRSTLLELETVHVEPRGAPSLLDAHKLDLENAVLMQELMAIKEEKAELKAQVYLLEKEKASLELQSGSWGAREQAYTVSLDHLRAELGDLRLAQDRAQARAAARFEGSSPEIQELAESQKREKKLKARIDELLATLEKITKNSELRSQQSAEFVNDLKRANSALVSAFEKAKKKNLSKMKKIEQQTTAMTDRHNTQVRMLKQRIAMLEASSLHHALPLSGSETSL